MRRRLIGISVITLLLVVLIVPMVSADSSQTWRLLDTGYTGIGASVSPRHHKDIIMSKTGIATSTKSRCADGETMWWYAENAANSNLGFGTENWTVVLCHETIKPSTASKDIKANIYKVTTDGNSTLLASGNVKTAEGNTTTIITIVPIGGQDFMAGERLALRIYPQVGEKFDIYYYKGDGDGQKNSKIVSPPTDPSYPFPELSTIVLFSFGVLTLGGYIWFKRRQAFSRSEY